MTIPDYNNIFFRRDIIHDFRIYIRSINYSLTIKGKNNSETKTTNLLISFLNYKMEKIARRFPAASCSGFLRKTAVHQKLLSVKNG